MQMITYLEEKGIREAAKVTKTSLHGYILHMEEQGKAATTISRMMAAIKAFFNYECMQARIRRNPAESLHAPKVEKKAPVILSVDQVSALLAQPSGQTPKEISGLSRRGEGADDPIWTFGESSAGGVFRTCEKRAAAWKGIGLFLCQLYRRRDEPAGILEDYQILRRESRD